ncbi:hypothetical protein L209DRAFT_272589 [Thermothelomyces heterothallicus CBS 203.75]
MQVAWVENDLLFFLLQLLATHFIVTVLYIQCEPRLKTQKACCLPGGKEGLSPFGYSHGDSTVAFFLNRCSLPPVAAC